MAAPTDKNPEIEALLTSMTGRNRKKSILANVCIYSEENKYEHSVKFTDPLSQREYTISGICQTCQDRLFDLAVE